MGYSESLAGQGFGRIPAAAVEIAFLVGRTATLYDADAMTFVRGALSVLAAILLSLFLFSLLPGVVSASRGIGESRATGLAVVAAGLLETALSPLFWISAVLICAFFFWAGGHGSPGVRVLLFWVPTVLVCVPGCGIVALITFVFLQSRKG